ncbi:MAG TPA: hypothetical protein DCS17_04885 [Flavobacterium sp.]|nr:hypothetical protein [Flavobacterium sp.]
MKKKLEADLMSIAHRVLQMKNKSDVNQLCIETRKLYEKLSILQFVEEYFEGAKPTIGQAEVVEKMKQFFEENHLSEVKPAMTKIEIVAENVVAEEEITNSENDEDEIVAEENPSLIEEFKETEAEEKSNEIPSEEESTETEEIVFQPAFELDEEIEEIKDSPKKGEDIKIIFDDFFGSDYSNTQFVKLNNEEENPKPSFDFELPKVNLVEEKTTKKQISENNEAKTVSLNEKLSKGISIDLNDRIAFVKHLFGNREADYNRVLNQLITYDNFEEAQNFIEDMVKPDYDGWEGKEDYAQRFVEIIEKKFA